MFHAWSYFVSQLIRFFLAVSSLLGFDLVVFPDTLQTTHLDVIDCFTDSCFKQKDADILVNILFLYQLGRPSPVYTPFIRMGLSWCDCFTVCLYLI